MSKTISKMHALAAGVILLATATASQAAVLDWSVQPAWSGTSNSYNVDGIPGNDITVSEVISGGATFTAGFPVISAFNTTTGLTFRVSTMGTLGSGRVTITIDFTGAYATSGAIASFSLNDVDKDFSPNNFLDQVTVTAVGKDLTTALPITITNNATTGGPTSNSLSGSGTTTASAVGISSTTNDPTGDVNVSVGTAANGGVRRITIVWDNPDATHRGTQTINLDNITFTPAPEVASSSAALFLCAGLFAFSRRRSLRATA